MTLSLPPASLAAVDQRGDHVLRLAGKSPDYLVDRRRVDQVGQAVAAEQQRGVGLERDLLDVDEIGVGWFVRLRADVAIDLVPARVLHRVELGQLVRVLALANRRVIARDLRDEPATQLVEPGVADVANERAAVAQHDRREDAGHAVPFGPPARQTMDFVVCDRNRLAQTHRHRAGLAFQPGPEHLYRDIGRFAARRLPADAVDDHEEPTRRIEMEPVFIDLSLESRVGPPAARMDAMAPVDAPVITTGPQRPGLPVRVSL